LSIRYTLAHFNPICPNLFRHSMRGGKGGMRPRELVTGVREQLEACLSKEAFKLSVYGSVRVSADIS
jgi:hypothetical protein